MAGLGGIGHITPNCRSALLDFSYRLRGRIVLTGALFVLPFIIGCKVCSYRVFRGKTPDHLYD